LFLILKLVCSEAVCNWWVNPKWSMRDMWTVELEAVLGHDQKRCLKRNWLFVSTSITYNRLFMCNMQVRWGVKCHGIKKFYLVLSKTFPWTEMHALILRHNKRAKKHESQQWTLQFRLSPFIYHLNFEVQFRSWSSHLSSCENFDANIYLSLIRPYNQ